eukprot:4896330-Prymnesium_polylepis.1
MLVPWLVGGPNAKWVQLVRGVAKPPREARRGVLGARESRRVQFSHVRGSRFGNVHQAHGARLKASVSMPVPAQVLRLTTFPHGTAARPVAVASRSQLRRSAKVGSCPRVGCGNALGPPRVRRVALD